MSLAQRDRLLIWIALGGLVALCWIYLIRMASDMSGMDMSMKTWSPGVFLMMFLMWAIMMTGMMVPTAMRSVMIFQNIAIQAKQREQPFTRPLWFALGYVIVWTVFSAAATIFQWGLTQASMLSPMMVSNSAVLGAVLLIVAGLWQFTPLKDVCLRHCQSPAMYISRHLKPGRSGALNLGVRHGLYCLGCCWVLMGLLFLGGVMNLLWIATITALVLIEKLVPTQIRTTRITGILMIGSGVGFLMWGFVP